MLNLSRNLGLITGASVMGAVFALASATTDITTARPEAVATGMRITFAVAAMLIVAALAIAVGSARGVKESNDRAGLLNDPRPRSPRRQRPGGFLRQIVADAAGDQPVRILAGELLGIGGGVRMRRAVGVAFQRDGRHGDDRTCGEPLFQLVIPRLARRQAEPPAVVVDHDADVIRIVEGRRAALEGRVVEVPLAATRVCQISLANSRRYLS